MKESHSILLATLFACLLTASPAQFWSQSALAIADRGHPCFCCPKCSGCCCSLEVKKGEEERFCWKVEREKICVPRIVFPWQNKHPKQCSACCGDKCCDQCGRGQCCGKCHHNGARVICVKVLKLHTYECPHCQYEWSLKSSGKCCGKGHCDTDTKCDEEESTDQSE